MRALRPLLSIILGALFFAAGLAVAAPASAHDAAVSTSPETNKVLDAVPAEVSVTFNNNPLGLNPVFSVEDSTGQNWADGDVQIIDNVATQKLKDDAPAGRYTVTWGVASSDGHRIQGTFNFSVTGPAEEPTPGATSSANATPGAGTVPTSASPGIASAPASAATVPTAGTQEPGTPTAAEPAADASEPFPWSIVIFAVVALALLIGLGVTARRRLRVSNDDTADVDD